MNASFNELETKTAPPKKGFLKITNTLKSYHWLDWMAVVFFTLYTVSVCFFIYDIIKGLIDYGGFGGWVSLDKFTYQSNVLLWLYMLFLIFFKKHPFLKNNQWLVANLTYIFFTFIGYNVILVGIGGGSYGETSFDIVSSVWFHVLCPVSFFIFGFCFFWFNKDKQPKGYWIPMLKQMIYPTIYVIYIVTIPFVLQNDSNLLDNTNYPDGTYTVYGKFTDLKNHLSIALPVILGMWIIFFPGSFAIFYYSWVGINKIKRN